MKTARLTYTGGNVLGWLTIHQSVCVHQPTPVIVGQGTLGIGLATTSTPPQAGKRWFRKIGVVSSLDDTYRLK